MKILHITAHLGGGAGKAIMGIACQCAKRGIEQKILLLEAPEKLNYFEKGKSVQIEVLIWSGRREELQTLLEWSDVAVFSWWNHPLSGKVLSDMAGIPCRLVLWSHVNGCTYPFLPYDFCDLFEKVFVTTTYTWDNPLWTEGQRNQVKEKSALVHGMGEFEPNAIELKETYRLSERFTIGYAGTLNYSKMHPEFVSYCKAVIERIPEVLFLMVGDADAELIRQVEEVGVSDYFQFVGYQEDIYPWYRKMDVLGYLLKSDNYATTENVILEAMSCGVPVITMNNPPEAHILTDGQTGYLVEDKIGYVNKVEKLYLSKGKRSTIGNGGRDYVCEHYSAERNVENFITALSEVCKQNRKKYDFVTVLGGKPCEWFWNFTGNEKRAFVEFKEMDEKMQDAFLKELPEMYKGKTKSSIAHFLKYYPEDEQLDLLNNKMKSNKG